MISIIIEKYNSVRYGYLRWRSQLSVVWRLSLSLFMAFITGLAAQAAFPLPWTPVPLTAQTLVVLLSGIVLGKWYGGLSQVLYVGMGVAGIPWFTGWSGGISHLAGPTGGYILGFIIAAIFVGHFTDNYSKSRNFFSIFFLMLIANFLFIHGFGILQLYLWLFLIKGASVGFLKLMAMGALPFMPGDIIKIILVAILARGTLPERSMKDANKFSSK